MAEAQTFPAAFVDASHRASFQAREVGDELLIARRGDATRRRYAYEDALRCFDLLAKQMEIIRAEIYPPKPTPSVRAAEPEHFVGHCSKFEQDAA